MIWEAFVLMGEIGSIVLMEKMESVEKLGRMTNGLASMFKQKIYSSNADNPHHPSCLIKTKASRIKLSAESGLSETLVGTG